MKIKVRCALVHYCFNMEIEVQEKIGGPSQPNTSYTFFERSDVYEKSHTWAFPILNKIDVLSQMNMILLLWETKCRPS